MFLIYPFFLSLEVRVSLYGANCPDLKLAYYLSLLSVSWLVFVVVVVVNFIQVRVIWYEGVSNQ